MKNKLMRIGTAALTTGALLGSMLFATGAAAANLTYSADTIVTLTSPAISFTIASGSTASSLVTGTGTLTVGIGVTDAFTLTSVTRGLTVTSSDGSSVTVSNTCSGSTTTLVLTSVGGTGTYLLTPTAAACTETSSSSGGGGGGGGGGTSYLGNSSSTTTPTTPTTETNTPSTPGASVTLFAVAGDGAALSAQLGVARDAAREIANLALVKKSATEFKTTLSEDLAVIGANFVTYGVSAATIKLGSGERLALVRDQLETLGRIDLGALEQLATGQKPTTRNLPKEQAQVNKVLAMFRGLTGHTPNFKNAQEDLAWNTMMYRIRFTRDLVKERAGIVKFRAVFGRTPVSPLDWASVRAWGYALQ